MTIYGSVCSGIESASLAWGPLGWRCAFLSEIERFPRAVLAHRYPDVPLRGDFTEIREGEHEPIDVLAGGTPCQSFSAAGRRLGLDDPRGNLSLAFLALARRLRPRWLVFENVPGLLSNWSGAPDDPPDLGRTWQGDEHNDFAAFLGALVESGYGCAWRRLDARYFGLAQRRPRVFVVGRLGDWRAAAQVLFEPEGMRGDPAPGGGARKDVAGCLASRARGGDENDARHGRLIAFHGRQYSVPDVLANTCDRNGHTVCIAFGGNDTRGPIDVATAVTGHGGPHGRLDFDSETFVVHALRGEGFDDREAMARSAEDGTGRGTPIIPVQCNGSNVGTELPSLRRGDGGVTSGVPAVAEAAGVRRLTPLECERLQGLPDHWTAIPWRRRAIPEDEAAYLAGHGLPVRRDRAGWSTEVAPDGPRYKVVGNAMPVPVMAWIGARIAAVDAGANTSTLLARNDPRIESEDNERRASP